MCATRPSLPPRRQGQVGGQGELQYVPQLHSDVLGHVGLDLCAQEHQPKFLGQLWGPMGHTSFMEAHSCHEYGQRQRALILLSTSVQSPL